MLRTLIPLFALTILFQSCGDSSGVADAVWTETKVPTEKTIHFVKEQGTDFNPSLEEGGSFQLHADLTYWQDQLEQQGFTSLPVTLLLTQETGEKSHIDYTFQLQDGGNWAGEQLGDAGGDRKIAATIADKLELPKGKHSIKVYANTPESREVFGIMELTLSLLPTQ